MSDVRPARQYRLYVNAERTILVRVWVGEGEAGERVTVSLRDNSADIWGPEIELLLEDAVI